RARIPGHIGRGRVPLQGNGLLASGVRALDPLERSGASDPVAGARRAGAVREGQGRRIVPRRRDLSVKILLTGKNGQVGYEAARALATMGEVVALGREELDLADADAIRRVLRAAAPNVIVNAAAYTAVDKAEEEKDLARTVNGVAPGVLAEEAKTL